MIHTMCMRLSSAFTTGVIVSSLASPALAAPPIVAGMLDGIERITAPNEVTVVPFEILAAPFIDPASTFELRLIEAPEGITVSPTSVTTPTTEFDATLTIDRAILAGSGSVTIELEVTRFTPPDEGLAPAGEVRTVQFEIVDAPPMGSDAWLNIPMDQQAVVDRVDVDPTTQFALELGMKESIFEQGEPSFLFALEQSAPPPEAMLLDQCGILKRDDVTREISGDPMAVIATTLELEAGVHDAGGCQLSMAVRFNEDLVLHDFLVVTPDIEVE
ncbi:MAG: hypothetical protein AAGI01_16275, partial [Myxococcota bacterium]